MATRRRTSRTSTASRCVCALNEPGKGNGRIYTLVYQAQDACGNLSLPVTATVSVPASQGNGGGKPREGVDQADAVGVIFLPVVTR